MTWIDDLRELGYRVEAAQHEDDDDRATVYFVEGHGTHGYIRDEDEALIAAILEPDSQDAAGEAADA